jgi:hypothetical protein
MSKPPRLYKFESLTSRTLQNIKGQVLYFGSPLGFNDPYDCAVTPNIKALTDDQTEAVRKRYLSDNRVTGQKRHSFATMATQELREILQSAARSTMVQTVDSFLKNRGVTCFSEKNDDLLMWSHYGGQYRGVCLEFDTQIEPFPRVKPVNYVESLPQLSVAEILLDQEFDHVSELFCTKSFSWQYEREWRAIHKVAGTKYVYPAHALTGVYFGPDIDKAAMEIVCLILGGQNAGVRFYRGSRSTTEFKVTFEEFTYTTFLQAKELGLRKDASYQWR